MNEKGSGEVSGGIQQAGAPKTPAKSVTPIVFSYDH